MGKNKYRNVIISVCCVTSVVALFLVWNTFSGGVHFTNKHSVVDNVELKSNSSSSKELGNLAIMIGDKNNNYIESESSTFPSSEKYSFNPLKSGCIDANGNATEDSITYHNNIATIETDVTSYCYLYFDYVSLTDCNGTIGECLMDNPTLGLNTSLEGGLYRYQGEVGSVNNFVCFGTTSKEECLSDTDKYMYRVIGVNESNQLKLIKKEALNTAYAWHSDCTTDVLWPESDMYRGLNGSYFLNTDYVPSSWSEKIATTTWKYGDITNDNFNGLEMYDMENSLENTVSAKIGLMYVHDFYLSQQKGGINCSHFHTEFRKCINGWIILLNNDEPNTERILTRYGYGYNNSSTYWAYGINSGGDNIGALGRWQLSNHHVVRPTFFLTSDVLYKSGTGTIDSPIILETESLVVNKVESSSVTTSSITLNIIVGDNDLVDTYYYKCGDSANYLESNNNTPTCSGLSSGTSYSISVYVKDKSGKISNVKTVSLRTSMGVASTYIMNTLKPSGLNTIMEGGLYRFQGASGLVNNFICFGTTSKEECLLDTDKYMYRVIGIDENNQLKLIKKEALNTKYRWYSSYEMDITWPDSNIFNGLNGSYFLNTDYVSSSWSEKIATTTWKYGDTLTPNTTAANLYMLENGWTDTINAKVGLLYMHDYYYGFVGGNNCSTSGDIEVCKESWINLGNSENDNHAPIADEWTMSRYGLKTENYYVAWRISSGGQVNNVSLTNLFAARPVFFLASDVQYLSGTGTLADTILIS